MPSARQEWLPLRAQWLGARARVRRQRALSAGGAAATRWTDHTAALYCIWLLATSYMYSYHSWITAVAFLLGSYSYYSCTCTCAYGCIFVYNNKRKVGDILSLLLRLRCLTCTYYSCSRYML